MKHEVEIMGTVQSRDNVAMVQAAATVGQTETKMDKLSIMMFCLVALVCALMACVFTRHCKKSAKNWIRREVTNAGVSPPVIKVHTVAQ